MIVGERSAWLIALGIAGAIAASAAVSEASNIVLSGYNEDVVQENAPNAHAVPFDGAGNFWLENGVTELTTSLGVGIAIGLPSSRNITSATGSGVVYQLQPYTGNNVLRMGAPSDPDSGTMTVQPGKYKSLHILAASGTNGPFPTGYPHSSNITLTFSDGSVTLPNALHAYDWYTPQSTAPSGAIAIGGLQRDLGGQIDLYNGPNFALYETSLDLNAAGLSQRTLSSITFNNVIPGLGATSVFAVDGTVPEPAGLGLLALSSLGLLARGRRREDSMPLHAGAKRRQ